MAKPRVFSEPPCTTSIGYPATKLNYLVERALELNYPSRNALIVTILDDWIEKDKKKNKK